MQIRKTKRLASTILTARGGRVAPDCAWGRVTVLPAKKRYGTEIAPRAAPPKSQIPISVLHLCIFDKPARQPANATKPQNSFLYYPLSMWSSAFLLGALEAFGEVCHRTRGQRQAVDFR